MERDHPLGPFRVEQFLVPPPRSKAPRDILVLEDFILRWRNRQIVGLDIIHEDNPQEEIRAAVLREGLTWRGVVYFSKQAQNQKQISENGLELLYSYSERRGIRLDWQAGFWVNLEGKYWRHTYQIDPEVKIAICHFLVIDLEPTLVPSQGLGNSRQAFRRLFVNSVNQLFEERSLTSRTQAELVLIMEHIKRERGASVQHLEHMSVDWYISWYKQEYSGRVAEGEIPPGRHIIKPSQFREELAHQIDSVSFCETLTRHKRLLSIKNLQTFNRDVHFPGAAGQEVKQPLREVSPKEEEESSPRATPLQDNMIEEYDTPTPREQEEVDELMDDSSLIPDSPVTDDHDWDGPMREKSLSLSATASSRARSQSAESGPRADAETLRLLPLIPREIFEPMFMPANCAWECPVHGCGFVADFKGLLSRQILLLLSEDEIAFLTRGSWASGSPKGYTILGKVSTFHFEEHIKRVGLVVSGNQIRRLVYP